MVSTRSQARSNQPQPDNEPPKASSTAPAKDKKRGGTNSKQHVPNAKKRKASEPEPDVTRKGEKGEDDVQQEVPVAKKAKSSKEASARPEGDKVQEVRKSSQKTTPPKKGSHSPKASTKLKATTEDPEDVSKGHATDAKSKDSGAMTTKIEALMEEYGKLPLSDVPNLPDASKPSSTTALAHILNALLSSGRISHGIAEKTLHCCVDAGYADYEQLKKSTWEERTKVLTDGGYTRYREKMATQFGDLLEWIESTAGNDLSEYLSGLSPTQAKKDLGEIKGLGPVGIEIFMNSAQALWSNLAPSLDSRSLKSAKELGMGNEVEDLFDTVNRDAVMMARLAAALTTLRLEKKESELR